MELKYNDKPIITFEEYYSKYNKKGELKVSYYMTVFDFKYFLDSYKNSLKKFENVYDEKKYSKLQQVKLSDIKLFFIPVFKTYSDSKTFDYTYTEKDDSGNDVPRSTRKKFTVEADGISDIFNVNQKNSKCFPMGDYYKAKSLIVDSFDVSGSDAIADNGIVDKQNAEAKKLDKQAVTVTERHINHVHEIILVPFYVLKATDGTLHYMNTITGDTEDVKLKDEFIKDSVKEEKEVYLSDLSKSIDSIIDSKKKNFKILYIIHIVLAILGLALITVLMLTLNSKLAITIVSYSLMAFSIVLFVLNFVPKSPKSIKNDIVSSVSNGIDFKNQGIEALVFKARKLQRNFFINALISVIATGVMLVIAILLCVLIRG